MLAVASFDVLDLGVPTILEEGAFGLFSPLVVGEGRPNWGDGGAREADLTIEPSFGLEED